ncbi:MAG: aminodeoxychorismate lyase [Methylovulum sp.]|nr:aminodeoxychorismate lyase [Methylovulum sp.]
MFFVNGESRASIEISDRGFQYGDGLFETIEVINGRPVFLDRHLKRLQAGCRRLSIPAPDLDTLASEAETLSRQSSVGGEPSSAVLKLMITRGSGGRGYKPPDLIRPTRVFSLHPFPEYSHPYHVAGIVARFCDTRLGLNPSLAGIKHLNRLEQVLARAEWCDPAVQEGIMLDINGYVIEGTMSNLFYIKNNILYTADLSQAGVAGIMRGIIMMLSSQQGLAVIEDVVTQRALLSADEVFVCNSVIGIWPVKQIETLHVPIGPVTRHIQDWVNHFKVDHFKREAFSIG